MAEYAHPETLVTTQWVADNLSNPKVRVVEVDVDDAAYNEGHAPGAIAWAWKSQLCDTVRRDILSKQQLEALMRDSGISNDTTVILYGDNNNWFAAWALWQLKMYGHKDVRLMNGGRKKWLAEGRAAVHRTARGHAERLHRRRPDLSLRAFLPQVQTARQSGSQPGRRAQSRTSSPAKFSRLPDCRNLPARRPHSRRRAASPGPRRATTTARSSRWTTCRQLYAEQASTAAKPVIAYCRIGERSSHTWFVLKYLLGYDNVTQLRRLLDRMGQPGRGAR